MNPRELKYTLQDIDNVMFALREGVLQMWISRGVIELSDKSPGRGKKRLFSFAEALQIEIACQLTNSGETSGKASAVGKAAAEHIIKWIESGNSFEDYSATGEEPIMLYNEYRDKKLRHWLCMKKHFDINDAPVHFSAVDFYYIALQLYTNLELAFRGRVKMENQ